MRLDIISAGAAQSVVQRVAAQLHVESGLETVASYGAVGAQKQKLLRGAAADLIILTAAMIDELIGSGQVVAGSRRDLGAVGAGIAVRSGTVPPEVSDPSALSASLVAASAIYIPDPAIATAGIQFMKMCTALGIVDAIARKLRTFPNGFSAMTALAASSAAGEIGCTQITEIKLVEGVDLVSPLPPSLQTSTVYSLGLCSSAQSPGLAAKFAEHLAGPAAAAMLTAAGFDLPSCR